MTERANRRLAAIVAADVAGFSRLVGADEEGTLAALRAHRGDLVDPLLAEHGGRVANTAGDSLLLEFPSVVDALRCSIAVQEGMAERNSDLPEDRRILFRVGINLGDVIAEGEGADADLLGDGVNVAARLEALAEPGGIVLSRSARDQVRDRVEAQFDDLGEVEVKNIARPVRAFRLLREGEVSAPLPRRRRRWPELAAASVVLIALLAGAGHWYAQRPEFTPADPAKMEYALDEPSIAVLAFDNLTGDPEQERVSDGISEDIISTLARLPGLVVIARNSSFSYKGQAVDVRQIAEEMSVRYVLEGSVQSFGENIRITAQLIDAVSGHHVWSQNFDRPSTDFFKIRDEITRQIVEEMNIELLEGDSYWSDDTSFKSMDAWLMARRALWHIRRWNAADNQIAIDLNHKLLALEPRSAWVHERLAWANARAARHRWADDPVASLRLAESYAEKAIALDDRYPGGYVALGYIRAIQRRPEDGMVLNKKALELAPGDPGVLGLLASGYLVDMQAERAIEVFQRAIRVDRKAQSWVWQLYGEALVMAGRCDEAIQRYLEALRTAKGFVAGRSHLGLAHCYDASGRDYDARAEVESALEAAPQLTAAHLRHLTLYKDQAYEERRLAVLKRLGLPEE